MGQAPIFNASSRALANLSGDLPQVDSAMLQWFQDMTFEIVTKTTVNFQVVETVTTTDFQGVWMPDSPKSLDMKPQGQYQWSYYRCFSQVNLQLHPDDIIVYLGVQYRVLSVTDYSLYAYWDYRLVQDYTGSP